MITKRAAIAGIALILAQRTSAQVPATAMLNLDDLSELEIWYRGQVVHLTAADIFVALGGHVMIDDNPKPVIEGPR